MSASNFTGQPEQCDWQEMWTIVNETALWEVGLPIAVCPMKLHQDDPRGPHQLALFLCRSREHANEIVKKIDVAGMKPLKLSDMMFAALTADLLLIAELSSGGITHIAKFTTYGQELPEIAHIDEVLARFNQSIRNGDNQCERRMRQMTD